MRHAAATLGSGNLRLAVMLPEGEDLNEWVAVNSECEDTALDN
jgi:MOB kinase activator 1